MNSLASEVHYPNRKRYAWAGRLPVLGASGPEVLISPIKIPQPDGSWLIRPGPPLLFPEEVTTSAFARVTGLSQRYVSLLCHVGFLKCRRASPRRRSRFMIPRSEILRVLRLQSE